ncbi:MAG: GNAT family N-acetyltransferase [Kiritimatiellia bacterium]
MALDLRPVTPADHGAVRSFLAGLARRSPSVLAYHDPLYIEILSGAGVGEPWSLAAFEGGEVQALLPCMIRRAESGCAAASLPFFGPNAGVLCAEDDRADELHDRLLGAMIERLRAEPGMISFSLQTPFLCPRPDRYARLLPDALRVDRFTQHLDTATAAWPWKERAFRKAVREGVTTDGLVTPERLAELHALHEANCAETGMIPKPRRVLDDLATRGVAAGLADVRFAWHGGRMVSGLITMVGAATASYYLPCTLTEARSLQPGSLLIDQVFRDLKARGVRHWNWEGSPSRESGVYDFKSRWGSVESPYQTLILPLQPAGFFRAMGRERIARDFPFFFVYPFHLLYDAHPIPSRPEGAGMIPLVVFGAGLQSPGGGRSGELGVLRPLPRGRLPGRPDPRGHGGPRRRAGARAGFRRRGQVARTGGGLLPGAGDEVRRCQNQDLPGTARRGARPASLVSPRA